MTRALRRTHFHSSSLMRVLSDLALVEHSEAGDGFAEKLGLWVSFTDAITLCAAHNASGGSTPTPQVRTRAVVAQEFARKRAAMEQAISDSAAPRTSKARNPLPAPQQGGQPAQAADFEPYRRYYLAQQRDMEANAATLRSTVRATAARAGSALRQLAALDEALDAILGDRQSRLLATIPSLLEKRFKLLQQTHQGSPDNAQQVAKPGGWLTGFGNELQTVLLAELDLRLQPTLGLIEALQNKNPLNV